MYLHFCLNQNFYISDITCKWQLSIPYFPRCVYTDWCWQSGDVGWFLRLLWSCSGISVPAGFSEYKCLCVLSWITGVVWADSYSICNLFTSSVYLLIYVDFFQFFACLLIVFGAEVAAGVFGFLNKEKVCLLFHSLSSWWCFCILQWAQ